MLHLAQLGIAAVELVHQGGNFSLGLLHLGLEGPGGQPQSAVVLTEVPERATAVGIPAKVVRIAGQTAHFADEVDQTSVEDPTQKMLEILSSRLDLVEKLLDERYLKQREEDGGCV